MRIYTYVYIRQLVTACNKILYIIYNKIQATSCLEKVSCIVIYMHGFVY